MAVQYREGSWSDVQGEVDAFLEEAVVRRELSDNYVFYTPNYDSLDAAANWAKESLEKHKSDKREHIYTWWVYLPWKCNGALA